MPLVDHRLQLGRAGSPHELSCEGGINNVLATREHQAGVLTDDRGVLPTGANIKRPGTFSYSTAAPTAGLRSCAGAGVRAQVSIQSGRD